MVRPSIPRLLVTVILCLALFPAYGVGAEPSQTKLTTSSKTVNDTSPRATWTSMADTRIRFLERRIESLTRNLQSLRRELRQARRDRRTLQQRVTGLEKQIEMVRETMDVRGRSGHFQQVNRSDYEKVQEGMSSAEVRELLGPAHHVGSISYGNAEKGTGEAWQYKVTVDNQNRTIMILFRQGRVDHKKLF